MNTKTILSAIALTLLCAAVSKANPYCNGGGYYRGGYGGGCGGGGGYYGGGYGGNCGNSTLGTLLGVAAIVGAAAPILAPAPVVPVPVPCVPPGYYGGGYRCGMYGQPYTVPTYRAGYGYMPY